MNPALWAAKTGLDAQQTRMTVTSQQPRQRQHQRLQEGPRGVRRPAVPERQRQVGAATSQDTQLPTGLNLGTGVRVVATEKSYTQGNMQQTGNSLDVAVNGRGFFQVLLPDGTLGYTRDGSFQRQRAGRARHLERLRGAAGHHDSRRRADASRSAPTAWSACSMAGQSAPDAGRHAAAHRLRQSRRPAAARREPAASNPLPAARRRPARPA